MIDEETSMIVTSIVQDQVDVASSDNPPDVKRATHLTLSSDCGLDNLDIIEIIARLEVGFDVSLPDTALRHEATVADLIALVDAALRFKAEQQKRDRVWENFPEQVDK